VNTNGTITGTPTVAVTNTFRVRVTDSATQIAEKDFTLAIAPEMATIVVSGNPVGGGVVNGGGTYVVGSSQQISATPNLGWAFLAWNDSNTQSLRTIIVPSGGASYTASFYQLTRVIGLSGNLAFGNVTVGSTATATLTIQNTGNTALTVSGINYPTGFSGAWSGIVPTGASQNVTVTFSPVAATTYGGNVTVTSDATSGTSTIAASGTGIQVPTPLSITTPSLLATGSLGHAYSATLLATGGASPYTWSTASGILPPGLTLSSGGLINGTPTLPGTYTFNVAVSDSASASVTGVFVIAITPSWKAEQLQVGLDGNLRLLWRHLNNGLHDGQVCLWTLNNTGVVYSAQLFGPYNGWSVERLRGLDNNNQLHMLWTNVNGAVSAWTCDNEGALLAAFQFGPYPGWQITDYRVSRSDNKRHMLWQENTGRVSLWTLSSGGAYETGHNYGPYPSWSAFNQQINHVYNTLHLAWTNTAGYVSLWRFDSANAYQGAATFMPTGWSIDQIALSGSNNKAYVVWRNAAGAVSLWRLSGAYGFELADTYGPFSGWNELGLLLRPGGYMQMVWENYGGAASFWQFDTTGAYQSAQTFGPFAGWQVIDACVDADNKMHILWGHTTGQISLWRLSATGALESAVTYGPY
jgi:hypothetical protein